MSKKFHGEVHNFKLNGHNRQYIVQTVSYGDIRNVVKTDKYSAEDGSGEQREVFPAHAKAIRNEMLAGTYTPTPIAVGVREKERAEKITVDKDTATIEVNDKDTLPLLDAGHRFYALNLLLEDDKVKADVLKLPITATFYLDGNTKQDFLNLQLGRTVDRAHMLSLKVQTGQLKKKDAPVFKVAIDIARLLATTEGSPFYNQIRFDSRGAAGIPVNTLCSKGASDLGTSLVGTAKLAIENGKDAEWAAKVIVDTFKTIKVKLPQSLLSSMVLCPPPYGTRGAATMLVGVGNMMVYRLSAFKKDKIEDADVDVLIDSVKKKMSSVVNGNFSGQEKRKLLGGFVGEFLGDLHEDEHEMVPIGLITTLSSSTFGVSKLPKKVSESEQDGEGGKDFDVFDSTAPTSDDKEPEPTNMEDEKAPWEEEGIEG